jgi:transcriptional regulator GlxA family with amidase domain
MSKVETIEEFYKRKFDWVPHWRKDFAEAKILLKHSPWHVSEIAYALAFTETTHFNNFFKEACAVKCAKVQDI